MTDPIGGLQLGWKERLAGLAVIGLVAYTVFTSGLPFPLKTEVERDLATIRAIIETKDRERRERDDVIEHRLDALGALIREIEKETNIDRSRQERIMERLKMMPFASGGSGGH